MPKINSFSFTHRRKKKKNFVSSPFEHRREQSVSVPRAKKKDAKKCRLRGSNSRPCACEAHVITNYTKATN